jgi:hypothetical protein
LYDLSQGFSPQRPGMRSIFLIFINRWQPQLDFIHLCRSRSIGERISQANK